MTSDEAAWRKAIADQVRANCTLDFKMERVDGKWVMTLVGDAVIYAVADWIENPPEWSKIEAPDTTAHDAGVRADQAERDALLVLNDKGLHTFARDLVIRRTDAAAEIRRAVALTPTTEETEQTIADLTSAQFSALKNGHESEIPGDH